MIKDMTNGSPFRLILGFSIPLLAGMVFQQLYNMVDTMIVGRFLGVQALAGVGSTGSVNFFVLGFCMGLCSGFAIPVAQCFGAKDERSMREYVANGVLLSAAFALILTVVTVLSCRDFLRLMDTPQDCFEEAYSYIRVIFAGIPFTFMYNLLSGYLRSLGDSKTPLMFLLFSSVLNVLLDLLLILVLHLGVTGAALATVISQGISGFGCLVWVMLKVRPLHIQRGEWRINPERILRLCSCGIPMGLQYSITAIGSIILQTAVNSLGYMAIAAVTASGKVFSFLACPFDALGSTMATYGAQNVGAMRYERLNRGVLTASLIGIIYSIAAFALVFAAGDVFVQSFMSGEGSEQIVALAHRHLNVVVGFFPTLALVNIVRFMIQGMGFSALAVFAGFMEMVARMLVGGVLVPLLGFAGVCLGNPLAWILADAFLLPAFIFCKRRLEGSVHHMHV